MFIFLDLVIATLEEEVGRIGMHPVLAGLGVETGRSGFQMVAGGVGEGNEERSYPY